MLSIYPRAVSVTQLFDLLDSRGDLLDPELVRLRRNLDVGKVGRVARRYEPDVHQLWQQRVAFSSKLGRLVIELSLKALGQKILQNIG